MPAASAARLLRLRESGSGRRAGGLGREVARQAAIGARRVTCALRRGARAEGTRPALGCGAGVGARFRPLTSAEAGGRPRTALRWGE